ncbi:unnamed protein product, partial [marine sediment metagenome]
NSYIITLSHSYYLTWIEAVVIVINQGHFGTTQSDVKGRLGK